MSDPNAYYNARLAVAAYDLLTGDGPFAGDVEFYLRCAERFGKTVLELGVGTGRVLIPLAEAGCAVTGLDSSAAMLDIAAAKIGSLPKTVADRIDLVRGDMQQFELGRRFQLVLIPARAFQHIVDPAMQRAALRAIHRHLEPGGHLVMDLFDPKLDACVPDAPLVPYLREARDSAGRCIRRTTIARENDPMRQIVSERLRLEAVDAAGEIIASEETSWSLRWTLRQEMVYLLELASFEAVAQYSDFQESPPGYAREQIWIARAV